MASLREQVDDWHALKVRGEEALGLWELALVESDDGLAGDISEEIAAIEARLDKLEFQLMFSGEHDSKDAIVAIHAGAGGTESQDWAEMMLRMYLRWVERHRYHASVLSRTEGEEAGIKSVTFEVRGLHAFGRLTAERGVHRLVRLSPYDSAHRRHTSFALVEVLPDIGDTAEVEINQGDLRIDVFRAAGAGGQHMQKNDTAIRITHLPTGIVSACQNERSQFQNREAAMRVLRARLYELEQQKRLEELARLKGEHVEMGWGNQIRSYVLHPYNMVKDHRTGYETGHTAAVLDGDLDAFIEAYLSAFLAEEGTTA